MALETDRLLLRPISEADADAWAEFFADAEARKWLHSPGSDEGPVARAALARWIEAFDDPVGMYAVVVRATGEVAGWVGFVRRELDWGPEIELGWLLRRTFHGRGYATEAARALRPLVPGRVVSMIRVENEPSQNVARKLGMAVERELDYAGFATKVFVSAAPTA
jgi:RimJ/RimL family protein N-acetyltransferase